jgi:F-type H+-transporting ATPase subunit epsilon
MKLEILTPDRVVFSGENITLVQLPGIDGSFEIMNDHAPLISVLKKGEIKVLTKDGNPQFFTINGGVIEVLNNRVQVLAE